MISKEEIVYGGHVCKNNLEKDLRYALDTSRIWDKNSYIDRTFVGEVFPDNEGRYKMRYVLGNTFIEGSVEGVKFNIYIQAHGSFQLYVGDNIKPMDEVKECDLSGPYYRTLEIIPFLEKLVY